MGETVAVPQLRGPGGRALRLAHLTTVDMSLALLLATELQVDLDAGLEVWGISAPGPYVEQVEALGVRHLATPALSRAWKPADDARALRELVAALRALHPDIVHAHTPKAGILGRVLGRALRVPVVVNTCHGLWTRPGQPAWVRAGVLGVEGLAALTSHAELYQNAEDAQALRLTAGRRGRVVGNGIDLDRFGPDPDARRRLRAEWGVPDSRPLVGVVGRRVEEKGLREYVAAALALAPRAEFVWIGPDDPDKPDAAIDRPDGVRWLGERQDMPAVYAALDIFVLPSFREGFSRSAMEAAASGAAMVLSDIRGCREIGRHGEHLLLVPPGDVTALGSAIGRLLDDESLRVGLGRAARERALAEFDQRRVARRSLDAYCVVSRRRSLGWTRDGEPC